MNVLSTLAWLRLHREHGDIEEQPLDRAPTTCRLLVCECGRSLICYNKTTEATPSRKDTKGEA